jgi:hypothetical protein
MCVGKYGVFVSVFWFHSSVPIDWTAEYSRSTVGNCCNERNATLVQQLPAVWKRVAAIAEIAKLLF